MLDLSHIPICLFPCFFLVNSWLVLIIVPDLHIFLNLLVNSLFSFFFISKILFLYLLKLLSSLHILLPVSFIVSFIFSSADSYSFPTFLKILFFLLYNFDLSNLYVNFIFFFFLPGQFFVCLNIILIFLCRINSLSTLSFLLPKIYFFIF